MASAHVTYTHTHTHTALILRLNRLAFTLLRFETFNSLPPRLLHCRVVFMMEDKAVFFFERSRQLNNLTLYTIILYT